MTRGDSFLRAACTLVLASCVGCAPAKRERAHDAGAASARDVSADAGAQLGMPRLVGAPWTIAHNPDLGALTSSAQQPVDFGVWRAADGSWQLWSCIRETKAPGKTRLFHRWQGAALTDVDWEPQGIAMQADPSLGEEEGGLQAPYVLRVGDTWHMFYGDYEHICRAESHDGKAFTRVLNAASKSDLFRETPFLNTRDPMLLRDGPLYRVYYTDALGAVYMRTSSDLNRFSDSKRVAYGGAAGIGWSSSECPFVARPEPDGPYYMFRTQQYGEAAETRVYRSDSPEDFGVLDDRYLLGLLPIAAPELIRAEDGWYIAYLRADLQGIQVSRLRWD